MSNFIHREQNKRWTLPKKLNFGSSTEDRHKKTYKILGYRIPKKGESYLSGKPIVAKTFYGATDMKLLVVKPAPIKFIQETVWIQK